MGRISPDSLSTSRLSNKELSKTVNKEALLRRIGELGTPFRVVLPEHPTPEQITVQGKKVAKTLGYEQEVAIAGVRLHNAFSTSVSIVGNSGITSEHVDAVSHALAIVKKAREAGNDTKQYRELEEYAFSQAALATIGALAKPFRNMQAQRLVSRYGQESLLYVGNPVKHERNTPRRVTIELDKPVKAPHVLTAGHLLEAAADEGLRENPQVQKIVKAMLYDEQNTVTLADIRGEEDPGLKHALTLAFEAKTPSTHERLSIAMQALFHTNLEVEQGSPLEERFEEIIARLGSSVDLGEQQIAIFKQLGNTAAVAHATKELHDDIHEIGLFLARNVPVARIVHINNVVAHYTGKRISTGEIMPTKRFSPRPDHVKPWMDLVPNSMEAQNERIAIIESRFAKVDPLSLQNTKDTAKTFAALYELITVPFEANQQELTVMSDTIIQQLQTLLPRYQQEYVSYNDRSARHEAIVVLYAALGVVQARQGNFAQAEATSALLRQLPMQLRQTTIRPFEQLASISADTVAYHINLEKEVADRRKSKTLREKEKLAREIELGQITTPLEMMLSIFRIDAHNSIPLAVVRFITRREAMSKERFSELMVDKKSFGPAYAKLMRTIDANGRKHFTSREHFPQEGFDLLLAALIERSGYSSLQPSIPQLANLFLQLQRQQQDVNNQRNEIQSTVFAIQKLLQIEPVLAERAQTVYQKLHERFGFTEDFHLESAVEIVTLLQAISSEARKNTEKRGVLKAYLQERLPSLIHLIDTRGKDSPEWDAAMVTVGLNMIAITGTDVAGMEKALQEITGGRFTHFDPESLRSIGIETQTLVRDMTIIEPQPRGRVLGKSGGKSLYITSTLQRPKVSIEGDQMRDKELVDLQVNLETILHASQTSPAHLKSELAKSTQNLEGLEVIQQALYIKEPSQSAAFDSVAYAQTFVQELGNIIPDGLQGEFVDIIDKTTQRIIEGLGNAISNTSQRTLAVGLIVETEIYEALATSIRHNISSVRPDNGNIQTMEYMLNQTELLHTNALEQLRKLGFSLYYGELPTSKSVVSGSSLINTDYLFGTGAVAIPHATGRRVSYN